MTTKLNPQITGLRAIAIIGVVFYHLNPAVIKGGFLGVDVFFVISGFLITRLIYKDLQTSTFSLLEFYKRRIRRLMPALIVVVFATLIAGYFILPIDRYERLGLVGFTALASVSNFLFWQESGYFDLDASIKPLLHTWSLAVEEQFYLFWPITLIVLVRFGDRIIKLALGAMFAASLVFVGMVYNSDANAVFYLLPARIFEFSLGASLVWMPKSFLEKPWHKETISNAAILLLIISIVFYDPNLTHPALYALAPCLATVAIIYTSTSSTGNLIFGNRFMQGIGLISYSLYLVHWPILVYLNYLGMKPYTFMEIVTYLIFISALSTILYFFIEEPFRRNSGWLKRLNFQTSLPLVSVLLFSTAAFAIVIMINQGFISRYNDVDLANIQNQIKKGGGQRARAAKCLIQPDCNKPDASVKVLVLGDSYSKGAAIALNTAYPEVDITLKHLGGCKPLVGDGLPVWQKEVAKDKAECLQFIKEVFASDFSQYDAIVFSLRWANRHLKYVAGTISSLSEKTDKLYVFGPRLILKEASSELLSRSNSVKAFAEISNKNIYQNQYKWVDKNLRMILKGTAATYIDVGRFQGGEWFNNLTSTGDLYIYDDGHLTLDGAVDLGQKIKQVHPWMFKFR